MDTNNFTEINLSYLIELSNNESPFMIKIIDKVLDQIPVFLQQIDDCLATNEMDRVRATAHKMANSMLTMGMKKAEDALHTIEENIVTKTNLENIPELISIVKDTCKIGTLELKMIKAIRSNPI